jgi:DNA-binding FadR family transcriptional regulator
LLLVERLVAEDGESELFRVEVDGAILASLRELAEATGLSKRAVQEGLRRLSRRRLVAVERTSSTAVPAYTVLRPWRRRKSA